MRIKFRDVALDAMLEERDHLKIRISLIEDQDVDTKGSAVATRTALAELEDRIKHHRSPADLPATMPSPPQGER